MYKKITNTFTLIIFLGFVFFMTKYYFSENNVIFVNKHRSTYLAKADTNNLPLLRNDTKNIITYIDDLEDFKKKRKKRFWEKLISNSNE